MLQNFGAALSREQMKNVKGGVDTVLEFAWVTCTWYFNGGAQASVPCSYSAESCQTAADTACYANNSCDNVDCR